MKQSHPEGLKWRIVIYGVIIVVFEILIYVGPTLPSLPEVLEIVFGLIFFGPLLALGYFGLMFLIEGWGHPKWYVKGYTVICSLWECYQTLTFILYVWFSVGDIEITWIFHNFIVRAVPPLIPIWYLSFKRYKEEEYGQWIDRSIYFIFALLIILGCWFIPLVIDSRSINYIIDWTIMVLIALCPFINLIYAPWHVAHMRTVPPIYSHVLIIVAILSYATIIILISTVKKLKRMLTPKF